MGENHRPQGNHASKAIKALNTELTCYISLHRTYNLYIKRKETTVLYTCKRFWSEEMNELGGAMHGEGLPISSPSVLVPIFPTESPAITDQSAGLGAISESPTGILGVSSGLPVGREVPRKRGHREPCM